MSLESKIDELIEAVRENTAALRERQPDYGDQPIVSEKPETTGKKVDAKKMEPEEPAEEEEAPDTGGEAEAPDEKISYNLQIEPAVLALARTAIPKGREKAKDILAGFGVKKASELDESDYAAFLSQIEDATKELTDE